MADANKDPIQGQLYDTYLKLDNTNPELFWFGGTSAPLPTKGITVKNINNNYKKCEEFKGSEDIIVYGNFRNDYFLQFRSQGF